MSPFEKQYRELVERHGAATVEQKVEEVLGALTAKTIVTAQGSLMVKVPR